MRPSTKLSRRRTILAAGGILLVQAAVLAEWANQQSGAVLSELLQLALGFLCILTSIQAFRRSGNIARYYWRWLIITFSMWMIAQSLGVYIDITSHHSLNAFDDLLFSLSVIPFGMLLFLDPDHEPNHFDRIHLLDFMQVCLFWFTVYLYFVPASWSPQAPVNVGPFSWTRSLAYDGMLTASFLLRAWLTHSAVVRAFFVRMAVFVFLSGLADSYAYYPANNVQPGHWFDLVWSILLGIPLLVAATWNDAPLSESSGPDRAQSIVINQFFPLLYPFCSFYMVAQVAASHTGLAALIMLTSFAGVGARMLVIQHRLMRTQDALRFKATHDPLTGLWNRSAVMDLIEKEIQRCRRRGDALGLMMVDLDHFKTINDTYGHELGDLVLQEVAGRLETAVRTYDSVGRYGGEEFLLLLPQCEAHDLAASAERLRSSVAESPVLTAVAPIPVTVSIGIASAPTDHISDCLSLLRRADSALYRAKSQGRNRVETSEIAQSVTRCG